MPRDEEESRHIFRPDFHWGASTAGHQVDGGSHDQWTVWELENAAELARTAEQRLGRLYDWNRIKRSAGAPDNYISGKGVEHYERYKEDFDILGKLNLNAFRFSIEWSRLEPEPGKWDHSAIQHYHDYIDELQRRGIEPFANLWHWTVPVWFAEAGGFEKRANLKYFDKFVTKVAKEFGKKLKYVIVLNEPNVYASASYLVGEWTPNTKNLFKFIKVYWHLTRAHRRAYKILKSTNPRLQIGIAAQLANAQAKRPHDLTDVIMTKWMRYAWNWWFLNRINKYQDFVGMNYYFTDYYAGFKAENPKMPLNDLGWYMEPEGIYPLLLRVWSHYKKPIYVTENGLADSRDEYRHWWLEETMVAMERAMSEGVDLRGYFHWSLLDNFEWKYGWWPQFGLVDVDRRDMKRTIRPSAKWWADWLEHVQHHGKPKI